MVEASLAITTVVLFDIDGTLIHAAGAGVRALHTAFERRHGRAGALDGVPIAGRTDRAIVGDGFATIGIEWTEERFDALRVEYLDALPRELEAPESAGRRVLPGVLEILNRVEQLETVALGLLTGNFERGAAIKLTHFGIAHRFAFGAYGDDHVVRAELVPVALEQARERGIDVTSARAVVIGDTPLDVECAHAHGAAVIAVATGPHDLTSLAACGPDLAVESLADRRVAEWLERFASAAETG